MVKQFILALAIYEELINAYGDQIAGIKAELEASSDPLLASLRALQGANDLLSNTARSRLIDAILKRESDRPRSASKERYNEDL